MDAEVFDRWTQGLHTRFSRRRVSGIAAGALATVGLAATVDAKKKKRKKNKNRNNNVPPIVPPGVNTTCQNLGTACGNTAICLCLLDKNSIQTCIDAENPPDGLNFNNRPCQANNNCGPGEVCLVGENVCVRTCAN